MITFAREFGINEPSDKYDALSFILLILSLALCSSFLSTDPSSTKLCTAFFTLIRICLILDLVLSFVLELNPFPNDSSFLVLELATMEFSWSPNTLFGAIPSEQVLIYFDIVSGLFEDSKWVEKLLPSW